MEDSRVFGNFGSFAEGSGLNCEGGDVEATRCTFEENGDLGLYFSSGSDHDQDDARARVELVDCVIRKKGDDGLFVNGGEVTLRGGTISKNQGHGVWASTDAKVTVVKVEEGKLRTVCKDNGNSDWHTVSFVQRPGEIIGIPQEKISAWD